MGFTLSLSTNPFVNRFAEPEALVDVLAGEVGIGRMQLTHEFIDPAWPAPQRLLAGGAADDLAAWGDAALADVAAGRPDALGWGDALALLARLGRLTQLE